MCAFEDEADGLVLSELPFLFSLSPGRAGRRLNGLKGVTSRASKVERGKNRYSSHNQRRGRSG